MSNKYGFSGEIEVAQSYNPRGLYIHQKEAVEALTKNSKKNILKTLLVIPTGGGKTFTSVYWVLKEIINKNKKVLWLAHRHELLNQTLKTAANSSYKDVLPNRKSFSYRIISGSSAHDNPVNIENNDDFIIASKDSLNYNKEYLQKWLDNNKDNVCLVIDEAHHATAKSYRNIISMVQNACKNNVKIIGLTATPIRTNEREKGLLGKIFEDGISYSVDLKSLINNGILSKPIIRDLKTDFKMKRELSNSELSSLKKFANLPEKVAKDIVLNKERNRFIVNHYIRNKEEYGKCLVFAINVDHAIALNALFDSENIKSDYVVSSIKDGFTGVSISTEENEEKINDFRNNKLDVLINVNILTEGTDIPDVQTIFLTRPTTSSILMNQMIGRGLRGKSAGGTESAYIVSFIDDWKYRINWVSPSKLLKYGEFEEGEPTKRKLSESLVPIKMIEEFTKFMDLSIERKVMNYNYLDLIPVGSYNFNIFDEENDLDKKCEVLVFDNLKEPYNQLMENLYSIFRKFKKSGEQLSNSIINKMYKYIENEIFEGYDLSIGFNEEDIKDILTYYELTGESLELIEFEGREDFDISKLVNEIIDNKLNRIEELEYIKGKWDDDTLGWNIYFNDDFLLFNSEIDRVMRSRLLNKGIKKPRVKIDPPNFEKLSLHQIKKLDVYYWRQLTDKVYSKHKNEDGYFESASKRYKSKNKRYFQIDHIIPLSKGGLTVLDNLQLLTRWENLIKKDKIDFKFDDLENEYIEEALLDCHVNGEVEKAEEIIKILLDNDSNNVVALNVKSQIQYDNEKYVSSIRTSNKVLKVDEYNIWALENKMNCYNEQEKYEKAIETGEHIISIDDSNSYVFTTLGDCYYEIRKYNIAINCYHKALDIDSNLYWANFRLGWIYSRNRKLEESNKYYHKALELDKECCATLNNIGYNYFKMKKYDDAIKYYNMALEIDPKDELCIANKEEALKYNMVIEYN